MLMMVCVSRKVDAFYEVHDEQNLIKIIAQYDVLRDQYAALEETLKHLLSMNSKVADQTQLDVVSDLADLESNNHINGSVALQYENLQADWNAQYDVRALTAESNKTSLYDYAAKVAALRGNTKTTTGYANQALGAIRLIETQDGVNLEKLMAESAAAPGSLAAAQVGNNLAALQTAQMIRMQYLMARNQHSQATYQAQNAVREEMATEAVKRFYKRDIRTTINSKSQMSGKLVGLEDWTQ